MSESITLILFAGGGGPSPAEQLLVAARQAAGRDLLDCTARVPGIGRRIVVTDDPEWGATLADQDVALDVDAPGAGPFHFGRRLAEVLERYAVRRALVMGAGSAPLLTAEALAEALVPLAGDAPAVVTNNLHSSDWAAFAPAAPVAALAGRLHRDNALGWVLSRDAGYAPHVPARSAATQFDLDTPADLALLARHPGAGPHTRAAAQAAGVAHIPVEAALAVLRGEGRQVILAGRVSSAVWAQVEARTQVWARVFAEERGMAASGRLARGEVRSALGLLLDALGPAAFWARLAEMADLVLMDSRVLLARGGRWLPAGERYASDLGRLDWIEDPAWREFTAQAQLVKIPVLLGGHSLVSGGILALLEML
jgi:hypothetical protein